jgi:hypothetical protein
MVMAFLLTKEAFKTNRVLKTMSKRIQNELTSQKVQGLSNMKNVLNVENLYIWIQCYYIDIKLNLTIILIHLYSDYL